MAANLEAQSNIKIDKQVTVTTPTHAASGTAGVWDGFATVTTTVTGVALGDIVIAAQQSAAVANQTLVGAYVSATDTVSLLYWAATKNTGLTGAASKLVNIHVLDRT